LLERWRWRAREAAKNAAEVKSNIVGFMDAIGVSAVVGQMQRAVRTKDDKVMFEEASPDLDQRLNAVSNEVDFEIQELQYRMEQLEKANTKP
jgi:hypothetical protein